jgi:hypothetical protein
MTFILRRHGVPGGRLEGTERLDPRVTPTDRNVGTTSESRQPGGRGQRQ